MTKNNNNNKNKNKGWEYFHKTLLLYLLHLLQQTFWMCQFCAINS